MLIFSCGNLTPLDGAGAVEETWLYRTTFLNRKTQFPKIGPA